MKTYGELKDFVRRTGVIHECVPMISSFTSIEGDGDRLSVRKDGVTRGFRFGMLNVDARRKTDSWIWFRSTDRTLREDSARKEQGAQGNEGKGGGICRHREKGQVTKTIWL